VAIRKEVIEKIGTLDEKFGIGMFEDDDYCMRTLQVGYTLVVTEECFIYHKGSVSFKKLSTQEYQDIFSKKQKLFLLQT
jgi:GT2 family glycosyltransferase